MDLMNKPELNEELLIHFGVKGMQWGVRNSPKVQKMKDDRKAQKLKAKYDRDDAIDAARARVNSGANAKDRRDAKAEYKAQKKVVGRRAARKVLREKRRALNNEYNTSQQLKSGRERTLYILSRVGGAVVVGGVSGVVNSGHI